MRAHDTQQRTQSFKRLTGELVELAAESTRCVHRGTPLFVVFIFFQSPEDVFQRDFRNRFSKFTRPVARVNVG